MKKLLYLFVIVITAFLVNSCSSDNSTNPTNPTANKGSIYVKSTPSGAQIWNGTTNTGKVTPDSLTNLDAGSYSIVLKLTGFPDTTVTATVTAGQVTNLNVQLPLSVQTFGPVTIYETVGTTAAQPSGLILSTGAASGIGSSATDRAKVDLYYSSTGFVLASADQASGLTRQTFFKIGNSTTLTDTVDSPTQDASWVKSVKDTETHYIFVKDNDNHYSKLIISSRGGGVPGTPAYVVLNWIYNKAANDTRF